MMSRGRLAPSHLRDAPHHRARPEAEKVVAPAAGRYRRARPNAGWRGERLPGAARFPVGRQADGRAAHAEHHRHAPVNQQVAMVGVGGPEAEHGGPGEHQLAGGDPGGPAQRHRGERQRPTGSEQHHSRLAVEARTRPVDIAAEHQPLVEGDGGDEGGEGSEMEAHGRGPLR